MSIRIFVRDSSTINNVEIAYAVIKEIESKYKRSIIKVNEFSSKIHIEDFLNPLVSQGFIDKEFISFVASEYGEPWVKGFPIDSTSLIEAICTYAGKSSEFVTKALSYVVANFCVSSTSYRNDIFKIWNANASSGAIYFDPIPKEFRDFSFLKDENVSLSKNLTKEAYDSVLESTEVILALTDDNLVKEQVLNIKEKLFGKDNLEKEE